MKRIILYSIFILSGFVSAAQPGQGAEKVRALYIAYVSKELNFTPDEAQRFWPVHQQYETELRAINGGGYAELDRQQKQLDLKRKFQPQFATVIGNERSNRFFSVSDVFMDKITGRLKQLRQERNAGGGGGFRRGGGNQFRERPMIKRETLLLPVNK